MLLLHQTRSQRLDAVGKLDAYHKALTTHVNDGRGFGGQSFQLGKEVTADAGGVFNEVFFLDDIKHSQGCRAGQMVATEGGAELTEDGFKLGGTAPIGKPLPMPLAQVMMSGRTPVC